MKRILLNSRYGDENYLEEVEPNKYRLAAQFNYRLGYESDGSILADKITFVDPSGGPFITRGYEIEGRKVTDIFRGDDNHIYLTLE